MNFINALTKFVSQVLTNSKEKEVRKMKIKKIRKKQQCQEKKLKQQKKWRS